MGPPPTKPPPPPPGSELMHANDAIVEWTSENTDDANLAKYADSEDDEVSDDEHSTQASTDSNEDASEHSEDAISVLAQAAVEEVMEAAVRQAPLCGVNSANQDSINANFAVGFEAQPATPEANSPTRPCSVLSCRPAGTQHYYDNKDSDESQDEEGWRFEENSPPPSLSSLTSRHSTSCNQPSTHFDDEDEDPEPMQEITPAQ
ncbi:WASH complex subunit 3-like [Melanotaenia boesemani]|uniref:WASH complex subunit 3-like n=1 Tax=Melanotaenia boesemani TaxID=1250792 RepID=UPI001C05801B|nr:WASH complex subunit 3-like [Melanotaenia boesemani]